MESELIEKYFKGELSNEELESFENRLDTDAQFKKDVEFYEQNILVLEKRFANENNRNSFIQNLKQASLSNPSSIEKKGKTVFKIRQYKKPLLISIGIAAAVLIALFVINPTQILYNQYAEHAELHVQSKGETDPLLLEASKRFNEGDFVEAEKLFEKMNETVTSDPELFFSLGITYLENDKFDKAMNTFKSEIILNSSFKDKSIWYQSLVFLKEKNLDACRSELEKIENNSPYYDKSRELMESIE